MNIDSAIPVKREQIGQFSVVDTEQTLTYEFDGKASDLGPALKQLSSLNSEMKAYRFCMLFLLILVAVVAWTATSYVGRAAPAVYDAAMSMTALGVCFVLLAYLFNKVVSKARSVNPTQEIRESSWAIAFMAFFFIVFPMIGNFSAFFEPVVTAKERVFIGAGMEKALAAIGISVLWVAVLCLTLTVRRLSKAFPQESEIYFFERILGHLVRDLSPRARCRVALNPLPVLWTTRLGTASSGKRAHYDQLLSARIRMGPTRRVSLRVVHRRTQRGRRKNKGSKHKVKVSVRITDRRLERLSDESRKSVINRGVANWAVAPAAAKEKFSFKAKPDGLLKDIRAKDSVGWVEIYLNENAWRSKLTPKDMPGPCGVLGRIRETFLALDELPAGPSDSR